LIVLAALSCGAASAEVANSLGLSQKDMNAPIQVSSDRFDADLNAKTGVYSGNVLVIQGEMKLRADKMRINTTAGKPDKIYADGNVVFVAPSGSAKGDAGVYDVSPRMITMTGRVVLTKEKNVMRGTTLVVNLVTGKANLVAKGTQGGRVQGLFTSPPNTQSNNQSSTQPNPQTNTQKPDQ
jgi:lipopolysaccharide export system protein LptA